MTTAIMSNMDSRVTGFSLRELAESVRNTYKRYFVFHSDYADAQAGALTLFVFHTYVWEVASHTPYVLISAPTSEAGKSLLFEISELLVNRPFIVVDPSPASIYNIVDDLRPTLMIDEADMLKESKALKVILNAGFQPGKPVPRAKRIYNTFCPKMFAGIAGVEPPLTEATLTRCIQINVRRRARHEAAVEKFIRRHAVEFAELLREQLRDWAEGAKEYLERAIPQDLPRELSDRQQDIWSQLFLIADMIGWGEQARKWAVTLFEAIPRTPDPAVQILADVYRVLDAWEGNFIPSSELARLRNELEDRNFDEDLSANMLGRRLAGFGINANPNAKRHQGKLVRGYDVRRGGEYQHQWLDAFIRYRVIETEQESSG